MATTGLSSSPLTANEKERLTVLLGSVSSHTLVKVLRDMERDNADARLILEVLLERLAEDETSSCCQAPVIPM